jgi:hypothetical protein
MDAATLGFELPIVPVRTRPFYLCPLNFMLDADDPTEAEGPQDYRHNGQDQRHRRSDGEEALMHSTLLVVGLVWPLTCSR